MYNMTSPCEVCIKPSTCIILNLKENTYINIKNSLHWHGAYLASED
jgi:hypothetical protein